MTSDRLSTSTKPALSIADDETCPYVTVIMPVRNEETFIKRSLGAVLNQDYPSNRLEVLVVDGDSSDGTLAEIDQIVKCTARCKVRVLHNRHKRVAYSMNMGIASSSGEIIVRVDGHTIVASDYIKECVRALERSDAVTVGGPMVAVGITPFQKAVAIATSCPFGIGNARFHYSTREEYVDTVYLGAWMKRSFDVYGIFDVEQDRAQDAEFNYRIQAMGGRIFITPRIRSEYYPRSSPVKLARQCLWSAVSRFDVIRKHPGQTRIRQLVPAVFVAAILFAATAAFGFAFYALLVALLALYWSVAVTVSLVESIKRREPLVAPLVFVAFNIIHVCFGCGIWWGALRTVLGRRSAPVRSEPAESRGL